MRKRSWTKEDLLIAVANSTSKRQTLSKLGLVEAGGNYEQLNKYIDIYKADTSHFTGYAWNKFWTEGTAQSRPLRVYHGEYLEDR